MDTAINNAKLRLGLSELNVNSILRHTIKHFHQLLQDEEQNHLAQGTVADRVKHARNKQKRSWLETDSVELLDQSMEEHETTDIMTTENDLASDLVVNKKTKVTNEATEPKDNEDEDVDSKNWQLFLASLNDEAGLPDGFLEDDDAEYNVHEDDADSSEEYRNDRAVRIPRKEVNEIKRLADKDIAALMGPLFYFDAAQAVIAPQELSVYPKPRYVMTSMQRQRLAEKVRNVVQVVSQLVIFQSTREDAAELMDELQNKANESWNACSYKDSLPSLFTPDVAETMHAVKLMDVTENKSTIRTIAGTWAWSTGDLLFEETKEGPVRKGFIPVEDKLLVWGLERFRSIENEGQPNRRKEEWELIRLHCLPACEAKQVRLRYKNLTAARSAENIVKAWKDKRKVDQSQRTHKRRDRDPHMPGIPAIGEPDAMFPNTVFEIEQLSDSDTHAPDTWDKEILVTSDADFEIESLALNSDEERFEVDILEDSCDSV